MNRAIGAGCALVAVASLASPAMANRAGIPGRALTGCGGGACHAGGETPDVELVGPSEIMAGGAAEFTLRVSGGQTAAGANIEASAGLLVPVDGTLAPRAGELVHSGDALDYTGGAAEFRFRWEAPDTNGPVDIYAAGNSVNRNGVTSGDNWGLASTTITVGGGEPEPDAGLDPDGDVSDGGDSGGDEGCNQRPGAPDDSPLPLLVVVGGALILARRRAT